MKMLNPINQHCVESLDWYSICPCDGDTDNILTVNDGYHGRQTRRRQITEMLHKNIDTDIEHVRKILSVLWNTDHSGPFVNDVVKC